MIDKDNIQNKIEYMYNEIGEYLYVFEKNPGCGISKTREDVMLEDVYEILCYLHKNKTMARHQKN